MSRFRFAHRVAAGSLVAFGVAASLLLGVAAPAQAAYTPGTPDPLYPNHLVWYDAEGGKWKDYASMSAENNRVALTSQKALSTSAQAVPSSFWARKVAAVKTALPGNSGAVAQVMEQGNLTRYSRTAVLVAEGTVPATAEATAAAKKLAPKIPWSKVGVVARGAGTAGLVIGAFQVGAGVGAFGQELVGIDAKGKVCRNVGTDPLGAFVSAVAGQDCGAFREALYVANADQPTTTTFSSICNTSGQCVSFKGRAANGYAGEHLECFAVSGGNGTNPSIFLQHNGGTYNGESLFLNGSRPVMCGNAGYTGTLAGAGGFFDTQTLTGYEFRNPTTGAVTRATSASTKGNPGRAFKTTITGTNGAPYVATSPKYFENGTITPLPVLPVLPPGVNPSKMVIEQTTDGAAPAVVHDQPASPEYQELLQKYPECARGACLLDLRTAGASCFAGQTDCADWFASPTKDADYSCKYGTYSLALAECSIYAQTFKPEAQAAGTVWADPQTGQPLGAATSVPGTPAAAAKTVADADEPRNCFPAGWAALNPVNWVMQPVQCALEWAFVPRASVLAAGATSVGDAWKETSPARVIDAIANWDIQFEVAGCDGVAFPFVYGEAETNMGIPSACPGEPLHPFAQRMQLYGSIVLIVVSGLAIRRHAGASIGYNA